MSKRFLLLGLLVLGLARPAYALDIWWNSAPGSASSGSGYYMEAGAYSDYTCGLTVYKNGNYIDSHQWGNNWESVGTWQTDYGAQTVEYFADTWDGYDYTYTYAYVNIEVTNNAPSIEWSYSQPTTRAVNDWFYIEAHGHDGDGNLTNVWVWCDGNGHSFQGGGDGYDNWAGNGKVGYSAGTMTFTAQAMDSNGAYSNVIYHNVDIYVPNASPWVEWNVAPGAANILTWYNVRARGGDPEGLLSWVYVWKNGTIFAATGFPGVWEGLSDNNAAYGNPAGWTYFSAQSGDSSGATSPTIYHNVQIINHEPSNPTLTADITADVTYNSTNLHYVMWKGRYITVRSSMTDVDGNLARHEFSFWKAGSSQVDPLGSPAPSSPSSSIRAETLQLDQAGRWDIHVAGDDGYPTANPGTSITVWVYGDGNNASFISQSINGTALTGPTPAISLYSNSLTATAAIAMKNTDSALWEKTVPKPYRLGPVGANLDKWGAYRDFTETSVDPEALPGTNDTAHFNFTFNIPQAPGDYMFQWRMLQQNVIGDPFFGAQTTAVKITVIDNTPPVAASNLSVSNRQPTSFKLNWTAATDNGAITGYDVFKDGVKINTSLVTTNSFTVPGLVLGNTYVFKVRAFDSVGLSTDSANFTLPFVYDPNADFDDDTMPNRWEEQYGFDIYTNEGSLDPDGDGVSNAAEYAAGTNPRVNESTALPAGWPNAATSNTNLVAFTPGSFNVDQSGGSNYSIPLWVSPGTAGMQPAIAISYNSNSGNGYLGVGWNLSGIPVISRRNATLATDDFIGSVKLESTDRFSLDGNRLLAVSETYGSDGAEYRTEKESFSRIYSYGSTGYGPERFVVKTKAGLTMEFGSSSDADGGRISAGSPASSSAIVCWSLDRITDAAGNYCQFFYTRNSTTGEFYIQRIAYTGNSGAGLAPYAEMEFIYEDRSDVLSGFVGGAPWARTKRLQQIKSKYEGIVVRRYALSYETSANTGRSRLIGVQEFDGGSGSLPAIAFQYKAETNGWTANVSVYEPPESLTRVRSTGWLSGQTGSGFVDLDGDGLVDFLHKHDDLNVPSGVTDTNLVARNTGSGWDQGFANASAFLSPHFLGHYNTTQNLGVRFVDLDSDGFLDIITSRNFSWASEASRDVWLNRANGWSFSANWTPTAFTAGGSNEKDLGVRYTDLDGDGRTDVLWAQYGNSNHGALRNNDNGSGWTSFPGGTNFSPPTDIRFGDDNQPQSPARLLDLNGDGLMDIIQYERGFGTSMAYLNTGTGWAAAANYAPMDWVTSINGEFMPTDFVDVNGDGLVDQVTARKGNGTVSAYFKTFLNTGKGWQQSTAYTLPKQIGEIAGNGNPGWSRRYGSVFADFNGDGLVDFMYATLDEGSLGSGGTWVYLNTGSGWVETSSYLPPVYLALIQENTNQGYDFGSQFLDVNGDGMVDLLTHFHSVDAPSNPAFKSARLNLSSRPDLLEKITASAGLQTNIAYKYLTDKTSDVYTRGTRPSTSTFPIIDVQNSDYVVRTVSQDDGSGSAYTLTYHYGELRQSLTRGNLGFGWMSVNDSRTNVTTRSSYLQDYPYIGVLASMVSTKGNGDKLVEVTTQWNHKQNTANSKVEFVFPEITIEKSFEPATSAATLYLTKTITNVCNSAWGDITGTTTEYSDGYKTEEVRTPTYVSAGSAQYPGQMTEQTIAVTAYSLSPNPVESKTRTSKTLYDSMGRLQQEVIEPNDSTSPHQYYRKTGYTRGDAFGNITRVEVDDDDAFPYVSATNFEFGTWDSLRGRFLTARSVDVGDNERHVTAYENYDLATGALKQKTERAYNNVGPSITTTYTVDSLGRVASETRPDGTTAITRLWSSSGPWPTVYAVQTLTSGGAPVIEFFDQLGRSRRTVTVLGDRQITKSDTNYDSRGLVNSQSRPYTGSTVYNTTTDYDELSRPTSMATPTGTYTYAYDGFKTTVNAPNVSYSPATAVNYSRSMSTETTRTGQGWVSKVVQSGTADSINVTSQIAYTYDPFGALKSTTDSAVNANVITITPDLYGRKSQVIDPDRGTWTYKYYSTGDLREQTDARNKVTRFEYDWIGRVKKRTVDATGTAQVTTWTYDTASGFGRGSLHSVAMAAVSGSNGYSESRTYDALGHVTQISRTIDGSPFVFNYTYDSYGRPKTTAYPGSSALTTRNYYAGFGHLTEIRNNTTYSLYFRGDEYSAEGNLQHAVYGNGVETDRSYRPEDGLIEMIQTGRVATPTELQNLGYSYEPGTAGNLYKRSDFRQSLAERFTYDGLARLTQVWRGPSGGSPGTQSLAMTYDTIGNLMARGGQGYTYGSRPHAVQTALGNTYSYDNNGNLSAVTGAAPATLTWKAFNQADAITQGGVSTSFQYDADLKRIVQDKGSGKKLLYVGAEFERDINGATTTDSQYIFTPLGRTVEIVSVNGTPTANRYYFTDNLGSVDTVVSDSAVGSAERLSYDAWGVRRLANWTAGSVTTTVRRGFTDHEMLDGLGLIHMNGRIYNPTLGRFLSADPINQDLYNTQTYNAYSYVLNNPLSYTDPTGMVFTTPDSLMPGNVSTGSYFSAVFTSIFRNPTALSFSSSISAGTLKNYTNQSFQAQGTSLALLDASFHTNTQPYQQQSYVTSYGDSVPLSPAGLSGTQINSIKMDAVDAATIMRLIGNPNWGFYGTSNEQVRAAQISLLNHQGQQGHAAWGLFNVLARLAPAAFSAVITPPVPGRPSVLLVDTARAVEGGIATETAGARGITYLYQKLGAEEEHLKFGITKNPTTRYTQEELAGGRLNVIARGSKQEMLRLERNLHETLPIGPEEGQKFYIQKQIQKGLTPPPYNLFK